MNRLFEVGLLTVFNATCILEEIILQNPGVVLLPKDSFGKRAAAKLGFKLVREWFSIAPCLFSIH